MLSVSRERERMHTKQKRQGPRLDRRNAIKNIDYDAATSSSSSSSPSSFSFDSQSAHRTRSLDSLPLSERTSFRIEGIDGEFDRICRSLGLSGPEDFAIPAAAWEARKGYSPISYINSSRFRYCLPNSSSDSPENGLSERFEASVRISKEVKHENKHSTEVNNGVNLSKVEPTVLPVSSGGISGSMEGESGIKGVRPSVLAPPPVMSRLVVDNMSSTWDLFRDFAPSPRDNEELYVQVGVIRPSYEDDEENNGAVAERIVEEPEGNDNVLSQSSLDTSNGDNDDDGDGDDDSFIAGAEIYNISPNGSFRCNIGSWQKGDFLGSGSFGTVYEGFTEDGFFFAVKEVSLLDQGTQGKQSIFQLEQEISLLSQFQHENIVQYLGTDKDDGKLYIFLELVTKGSLASLYQKYHLRDSQVSVYTRQILNGLNYLHEKNVVHRDIKCANILVDASGSVKLADFGLAKASKLNDIKSCKGTPFWMAPEVVNNRKKQGYGRAADIWSLGCTVLEMLTRQIPYSHLEGMQAMFRIGRGEPPPIPKSLSGEAQDFILKCLQVNPDDRPTADQLRDHPFVKRPLSTFLTPPSPLCVAIPS